MTTTQALAAFIEAARRVAAANDNAVPADSAEAAARSRAERPCGAADGPGHGSP